MKVGDLVRWTHPHALDTGLILEVRGDTWMGAQAYIEWACVPDHSGLYPIEHEHLMLLESNR